MRGHMWLNISTSNGDKGARETREMFEKDMSPSQIETAQNLARECVKKNDKGC